MKNIKKIIGIVVVIIGLTALCSIDSDLPLWGIILILLVGLFGFFGGGALYHIDIERSEID